MYRPSADEPLCKILNYGNLDTLESVKQVLIITRSSSQMLQIFPVKSTLADER